MAYSLLLHRFGSRLSTIVGVCAAAVVLVGGGGCYTDSINMAPTILSINWQAEPRRGQPATFTASVTDPDGDAVTLEWAHTPSCPSDPDDRTTWPSGRQVGQSYTVGPLDTVTPFCVWAFATDRHGAIDADNRSVDPLNHAPVAVIEIVDPVYSTSDGLSLYAPVTFSGALSTDEDVNDILLYEWTLTKRPPGSLLVDVADCPSAAGPEFGCLVPDLPGEYEVQLKVGDATHSMMARKSVRVADDQLPCVAETVPKMDVSTLVPNPEDVVDFAVISVTDDGDPYPPPPRTHFRWFVGRGTDPVEYQGNDFPSFFLPAKAFAVGDDVRVRVEILDRRPDAVNRVLAGCGDAALCAGRPQCFQRVTWRIQYR